MGVSKQHRIRFFDPDKHFKCGSKPCNIIIIGKRNSGKTTIVASLAQALKSIPYGVCCSCTEDANSYWSNHIPETFIHGEYTEDITKNLIEMQRREVQKVGKENVKPCFAIYDDIMYDTSFVRHKSTRQLFMNGRHFKISLLLTAQYCMDLPPGLRTNIDYVFILKDPSKKNRQRLFDNFAGIFPTFESFCDCLDKTTENYECMVIDNTSNSNDLADSIYYYKGVPGIQFKMGCKDFRKFNVSKEVAPKSGGKEKRHKRHKKKRRRETSASSPERPKKERALRSSSKRHTFALPGAAPFKFAAASRKIPP